MEKILLKKICFHTFVLMSFRATVTQDAIGYAINIERKKKEIWLTKSVVGMKFKMK